MAEPSKKSFDAALMMALCADAQKELDTLPTPEQLEELYPDTSEWDDRMAAALQMKAAFLIPESSSDSNIHNV